jgi:hypothetical protein
VDFVGLAWTPRKIAEMLSAAARAVASSATELSALGWREGDPRAVAKAAANAQKLAHQAALGASGMVAGRLDPSDVVAMALSLKVVADAIDAAAEPLRDAAPDAAPWAALTGVIRDAARELAGAIDQLDGPARKRDARLERVEALDDEGRRLLRSSRAELLKPGADLRVALTGEAALRRLERAMRACTQSARTIRQVAIKHS